MQSVIMVKVKAKVKKNISQSVDAGVMVTILA